MSLSSRLPSPAPLDSTFLPLSLACAPPWGPSIPRNRIPPPAGPADPLLLALLGCWLAAEALAGLVRCSKPSAPWRQLLSTQVPPLFGTTALGSASLAAVISLYVSGSNGGEYGTLNLILLVRLFAMLL